MYKVSIPVMIKPLERAGREKVLYELKRAKADRVLLCPSIRGIESDDVIKETLDALKRNIPYFKQAGFEVGVWICTLGHGCVLAHDECGSQKPLNYTHITGFKGETREDSFCPLDESFASAVCGLVKAIAQMRPDMIMLDDDYRFTRDFIGCCCDLHMAEYQKLVGEKITREELPGRIFCGGANKYRDAWLQMIGNTLTEFAAQIRAAVDSVDETIRLGSCAAGSSWDSDGLDFISLAKVFAGKTKPFLRCIGAPYWGWNLAYSIELERLQQYWCRNSGVEVFSEGDVYPRPRYNVPAAYLEGFDMVLRANGDTDGILKYMLDYVSGPLYETGYIDRHVRNAELYKLIDRYFSGKTTVGVNVIEMMHTLKNADLPENYAGDDFISQMVFPTSQRFLSDNSIPTTYGNTGCASIAFGENAKYIDKSVLKNGVILDVPAAMHLMDNGTDVGISEIKECACPKREHYLFENEYIGLTGGKFFEIRPKSNAKVLTEFLLDGNKTVNGVFEYENADGERLLVYPFDAYASRYNNDGLFRSYCRQRQLIGSIAWLQGRPLDAACPGNPNLYIMCKKGEGSLSVGLWNFFADAIYSPEIQLADTYESIEFINCSGRLESNKVILSDIPAFGFAGFEVRY